MRQNGKVFGPFTLDRLKDLLRSNKFDSTAEFGTAWDGPWGSRSRLPEAEVLAPRPVATQRVPAANVADAFLIDGDSGPKDAAELEQVTSVEFPVFSSRPPSSGPVAPKTRKSSSLQRHLPALASIVLLAVSVTWLASTSGTVRKLAPAPATRTSSSNGLADPRKPSQSQANIPIPTGGSTRSRTQLSNIDPPQRAQTESSNPRQPPETSTNSPAKREQEVTDRTTTPVPESAYDHLPREAHDAIKAVRSLRASVQLGINYQQYAAKVQELLPPVTLFLESNEAKDVPELRTLLTNASECYVKIKDAWNASIYSDSPSAKFEGASILARARSPLWEVAAKNVQLAYDLTSRESEVRHRALGEVRSRPSPLQMQPALDTAMAAADRTPPDRDTQVATKPPLDSTPKPFAEPQKPQLAKWTFNKSNIDVSAVRRIATEIKNLDLEREDTDLVEDVLSLTRSREWALRNGDKSWGEAINISPASVWLKTNVGEGSVRRDRLGPSSQTVVQRMEQLAEKLHALHERLRTEERGQ